MSIMGRHGLIASLAALAIGLALSGVARAQGDSPASIVGVVTGEVAYCVNGAEQPAAQVAVGVDGGSASLARTDSNGEFLLALPAGQYTVTATATDGTASRQYVPVDGGQTVDIGILDIGGGVAGCGPDSDVTAPVLPTFAPTLLPTLVSATLVPAPTAQPPQPSATPEPAAPDEPAMDPPADPVTGG